jgi:hypothetical protein
MVAGSKMSRGHCDRSSGMPRPGRPLTCSGGTFTRSAALGQTVSPSSSSVARTMLIKRTWWGSSVTCFADCRSTRRETRSHEKALRDQDFEALRCMGHTMKGSGGSHGLDEVSRIGEGIEASAKEGDSAGIAQCLERLRDFLERVQVFPVTE